jgi:protein-histidine N-methyltransferase
VLHLSTLPNLFLTALSALALLLPESEGAALDMEPSPSLISALRYELRMRNVSVDLISGAWGKDFVDTVRRIENVQVSSDTRMGRPLVLILASETIYAPASLHSFAETLVQLIHMANSQGAEARAFVAAKRVYFGVGGGVLEFESMLVELGGRIVEVWGSEGGVGRCIIEVMLA